MDILPLLLTGAKISMNPEEFQNVAGLTREELEALEREENMTFWDQTKELRTTIFTCAIAAIVQGWDQSSINGANLRWPRDLCLRVGSPNGSATNKDLWIFALINAAPFIFGALCGSWLCDPFSFKGGRRFAVFFAGVFCLFSTIGSAVAQTWQQLLICRVLLGIGMVIVERSTNAYLVPVYAAEVAPAHIRGKLVMNWQVYDALGSFLGFSANLAFNNIKSLSWRLQLAAPCLPAIPLLCLIYTCPESARFLIKKGKFRKAYKSLLYLNETPLQAARELYLIHAQNEAENLSYNLRFWRRFKQLFTVQRMSSSLIAAVVLMVAQQLCGINVIAFYSSTLFSSANFTFKETDALWLGWGFGLTNFLFAFPAYSIIDKGGRRPLLLTTIPILAITLLGAAMSFKIPEENKAHNLVISVFIILFTMFYSFGLGPVPFTYSAEVFPQGNREVGMSVAVFCNLLGAGILSLTVPFIKHNLHSTGLLGLFAGFNLVAWFLVFFLVYETKQATLEEMRKIFSVKTWDYVKYQFFDGLPWIYKYVRTLGRIPRKAPPYRLRRAQKEGASY
ncbi:hypothetical protein B0O99DRAFT_584890 [Bisporella sp. PMI_857]|nr:hypothetical protein B0O99DRAFT_584890 [Bisporella sp. PMI_857]